MAKPKTSNPPNRVSRGRGSTQPVWLLRLYIAGKTRQADLAVANLRRLCDKHLPGSYRLQTIDLLEHPELAAGHQILAIPTLVRQLPVPVRRVIGDLTATEKVLVGLDLVPDTFFSA